MGPDSPAAKAGIQAGDVMVKFNDQQVRTAEDYLGALRGVDPGDTVAIEVLRGRDSQTLTATIGTLTPETS